MIRFLLFFTLLPERSINDRPSLNSTQASNPVSGGDLNKHPKANKQHKQGLGLNDINAPNSALKLAKGLYDIYYCFPTFRRLFLQEKSFPARILKGC